MNATRTTQMDRVDEIAGSQACTGCGACVGACPYRMTMADRIITLDPCDLDQGRCQEICPRVPGDLAALRQTLFEPETLTREIGPVRWYYITRATDPEIRGNAQHGGTVTALLSLALSQGIIDRAVVADQGEDLLARPVTVNDVAALKSTGKSKFVVSPTLAWINQMGSDAADAGMVATPCQALAAAKLRDLSSRNPSIVAPKLVIGLFCGWALDWTKLRDLLTAELGDAKILKLDIPPSKYQCMEVTTDQGLVTIPLDKVEETVRQSCRTCDDMTAEFADISVGSARLPEGWETAKGWNQVIARTALGQELMELAREKGILEFYEAPVDSLEKLKAASLNRKQTLKAQGAPA
ncbi:MAG: Coenzyme F420 hydrogenase/dehydrogenase, beta subunit C-terminal domain [Desulfobacterales bacterium]|nr:Coenzyme F420 hydrogenase/dehydrogenase, beta subunit C-terminal domain [Desulfobacterales bacterium]